MKITLVETQALHPTDKPPWNAVSVTTTERSAFVTAAETGSSDAEFCLHHLILRVRNLEEDLASAQRTSGSLTDQRDQLIAYIEDLRKAHNQSDVLVHELLQKGPPSERNT